MVASVQHVPGARASRPHKVKVRARRPRSQHQPPKNCRTPTGFDLPILAALPTRRSLENRAKRLTDGLKEAQALARTAPPTLPDLEELDEMEEAERDRLERLLDAVTLAGNAEQVRQEIAELRDLAAQAQAVEDAAQEAKLAHLRQILQEQGFFERPEQRLLLFTEFTIEEAPLRVECQQDGEQWPRVGCGPCSMAAVRHHAMAASGLTLALVPCQALALAHNALPQRFHLAQGRRPIYRRIGFHGLIAKLHTERRVVAERAEGGNVHVLVE